MGINVESKERHSWKENKTKVLRSSSQVSGDDPCLGFQTYHLDFLIIYPVFLQPSSWLLQQWNSRMNIRWLYLTTWGDPSVSALTLDIHEICAAFLQSCIHLQAIWSHPLTGVHTTTTDSWSVIAHRALLAFHLIVDSFRASSRGRMKPRTHSIPHITGPQLLGVAIWGSRQPLPCCTIEEEHLPTFVPGVPRYLVVENCCMWPWPCAVS